MILSGAMQLAGPIGPLILVLVLCETLLSFAWLLYIGQKIFFGAPLEAAPVPADPPWPMNATLIILIVGCVAAPMVGMRLVQLMGK